MAARRSANGFDAIIIGSGIGGMTTATALSRFGHRVLLLEQAPILGGLTHSFSRAGFTWDVGLHYCGLFGPGQHLARILDWLSDGTVEFHSLGEVYDNLHFPGDFDIAIAAPAEAFKRELKEHFPDNAAEIDRYVDALSCASDTMRLVATERSMPRLLRAAHRWWHRQKIARWCGSTTGEIIGEIVSDPRLRSVLTAEWGTYGGRPTEASFAIHATVIGHYLEGAAYPVGGGAAIGAGLLPVIEAAGGTTRAATPVSEIIVEQEKAVGVRTSSGEEFRAPVTVSAIGAVETVKRLLPAEVRQQEWAAEISTLKPALCHFDLFLGFEGDIARHGATGSNHWFHESWDTGGAVWASTDSPIPMMFVSFSSLKDPSHDPGPSQRHTGDCMVLADWKTVAGFAGDPDESRAAEWAGLKSEIEAKMLAFFASKFPGLASLVVHHELGTPLSTVAYTGHEKGGFYGVETTPRRLLSDSLNARTPVPGLYLAGQDVMTPGIAGALMGGMLCASAIDPRVLSRLG